MVGREIDGSGETYQAVELVEYFEESFVACSYI
jgi:hypothetical protein